MSIDIERGSLIKLRDFVCGIDSKWKNRTCIYIGPDVIERDDVVRIVNHLILSEGKQILVDRRLVMGAKIL